MLTTGKNWRRWSWSCRAIGLVLDGLTNWYEVFVFTGGPVPAGIGTFGHDLYPEHPAAADCLSTSEIEHYRHEAEAIEILGQRSGPEDAAMQARPGR